MDATKTERILESSRKIKTHQQVLSNSRSYNELESNFLLAFEFIEKAEIETGEFVLEKVLVALDSVPAILSKTDLHGLNANHISQAIQGHMPKIETNENTMLVSTFKLFNSFFWQTQRMCIIEKNRIIQMNKFWKALSEKMESLKAS